MEKITLFYVLKDSGDGEAYVLWLLNEGDIGKEQISAIEDDGGFSMGEGNVETFVGSDIHKRALSYAEGS